MRRLLWFLLAYLVVLLLLAPHLSFWLDEVLTLTGAVQPDLASLMENLRKQQGATPLAFLIPHWTIQLFGLSQLSARLPSILAAVAACPALYVIARRAGVQRPEIPVAILALWPLQFRYALEVRPYALAQCLGLWLTLAFLSESRWWIYALLTVAMGLTHPYALVIPLAHLTWSLLTNRSRAILPALGLVLTALALAPWYIHFAADWRAQSAEQQLAFWNPRAALVFLRELSGSGYIGTAILIAGIAIGFRSLEPRKFWLTCAIVPIIAVPLANTAFDYFFAIRQLIYILPALALLLHGRWAIAAFLIASIYSNIIWLIRPREDWAAASAAIATEVSRGACVQFVGDSEKLFVFFRPDLASHLCAPDARRVVLAGSTYEPAQSAARAALMAAGLTKQSEQSFVAPTVEVYAR
jgi:mannosyltransferase